MVMMKIWWAINFAWIFLFSAFALVIGIRSGDAAGIVQTPDVKMVSFIILGVIFLFVVMIQLIFLYFIRKKTKTMIPTK
ncbi:DUF3923 family protein [Lysinibacillus irui]|nr:DUF3923 family protein [Lysinibacillus irui]